MRTRADGHLAATKKTKRPPAAPQVSSEDLACWLVSHWVPGVTLDEACDRGLTALAGLTLLTPLLPRRARPDRKATVLDVKRQYRSKWPHVTNHSIQDD